MYKTLDRLIIKAIKAKRHPLHDEDCMAEAGNLSRNLWRPSGTYPFPFRIIDRHIQSLRKAGKIRCVRLAEGIGGSGWIVIHTR